MDISGLNRLAAALEPLPYDPRLAPAMSEAGYRAYRHNTGHTYYLYLQSLVRILRPKLVLELGTDIGRSASFMMTALPEDSKLITVEIGSQVRTDLVPWAGDPRLRIIQGNDLDLSVYGDSPPDGVGLLFIDTDHTEAQVTAEWGLYRRFLEPGAVVALDDIMLNGGMRRFWDSLACPKADAGLDVHFSGFGIAAPSGTVLES